MMIFIKNGTGSGTGSGASTRFSGILNSVARFGVLILGALVGIGVFLFTASAALVLVITVVMLGIIAFTWFWVRAKFFGKPFGGKAYSEFRKAASAQASSAREDFATFNSKDGGQGDVLDAQKTPDGWTVNQ